MESWLGATLALVACSGHILRHPVGLKSGHHVALGASVALCQLMQNAGFRSFFVHFLDENILESQPGAMLGMFACSRNILRHPGGLKNGRRVALSPCVASSRVVHVFVCMILSTFWHENDLESQPGATPRMCACLGNARRHPGGLKSGRRGALGACIAPFRVKLLFVCVMLSIFLHDDNLMPLQKPHHGR